MTVVFHSPLMFLFLTGPEDQVDEKSCNSTWSAGVFGLLCWKKWNLHGWWKLHHLLQSRHFAATGKDFHWKKPFLTRAVSLFGALFSCCTWPGQCAGGVFKTGRDMTPQPEDWRMYYCVQGLQCFVHVSWPSRLHICARYWWQDLADGLEQEQHAQQSTPGDKTHNVWTITLCNV